MRLLRVTLEDWMPFGGTHVVGPLPAGAIGVVGVYADNPRRSNWAGKTSWLEAVRWCFHGVHRKRHEDDVIHAGADFAVVAVETDGGVTFERSRPRGGPTRLVVTEPDGGLREGEAAEARVDELLRIGRDDLDDTVDFAQGETTSLVLAQPADRRATVLRWLRLEVWQRLGARARARMKAAAEEVARLEAEPVLTVRGRPDVERDQAAARARAQDAAAELDRLRARVASLREALPAARLLADAAEAVAAAASARQALAGSPPRPGEEVSKLVEAAAELKRAHVERERTRFVVVQGFDGRCPVTSTVCPVADEVAGQRAELANLAQDAQAAYEDAQDAHQRAAAQESKVRRYAEERAKLTAAYNAAVERARLASARAKELDVEAQRAARAFDLRELQGAELSYADAARAHAEAAEVARRYEGELGAVDVELRARDDRARKLEAAWARRRAAELALRALSREVPNLVARGKVDHLVELANGVLQGTGLQVAVAWDRETKELSPECYSCGYPYRSRRDRTCPACGEQRANKRTTELELLVEDGGGWEDARQKSGAAKVLVGSALRLAAGLSVRTAAGSPVAWAVVDEPFAELDEENRGFLARALSTMLGSVGLEQAFVVSHHQAVVDALPARVVVTRSGSASSVRLET